MMSKKAKQKQSERMKGENNPMKNLKTAKKLSETRKILFKERKLKGYWLGKKRDKETIKKAVDTRIKNNSYKHTEEWKRKMSKYWKDNPNESQFKKGHISNRGQFKKGMVPWNKNLTKEIDERVRRYADKKVGKTYEDMFGKEKAEEIRQKVGNPKYNNILTKEFLEEQYIINRKEINVLAKELNIPWRVIYTYMKKYNIPKVNWFNESHRKKLGLAQIGRESYLKGKTYEKHFGKEKAREIKKKISKSEKGKFIPEETKKKTSKTMKGLYKEGILVSSFKGENNPNFNNWSSREPYGEKWSPELKEQIRKKYGYRCQQCFRHQDELFEKWKNGKVVKRKLGIHHIDYDKKNNSEENLIPLCNNCHNQTNFKREDWTDYFQDRVI